MQLKSIHFSGFKSFVDPTTFKLPANIIGIVGPNGCGKSNVIDAVRWVMGESSAKTLRGDNMADVIFNGSSSRKPVGKATVELLFDNSSGKAPGAYSQYAEISVKRSLSRDGQSDYFLNNVRCRRKDITEIFLGTGLGPRSYSIIEQGMVSRIVEARPEDLRTFVEEAAGVSKYKEKRRETESRIRRTRENLDRVEDISSELETQLRRLDRQSKQAKRYKELKNDQRQLKGQTLALKWQQYHDRLANFDVEVSRKEKELESYVAQQRESESKIETLRQELSRAQESLNQTQGNFYSLGADISAIEQKIQHDKETRQNQQDELKRIEEEITQTKARHDQDNQQRDQLAQGHDRLSPQVQRMRDDYSKLQTQLSSKELALQSWQQEWEQFQNQSNQSVQDREVLKANIDHLNSRQQELLARQENIEQQNQAVAEEVNQIAPRQLRESAAEQDHLCQSIEDKIEQITNRINEIREKIRVIDDVLKADSNNALEIGGKLESLKELQKAALGQNDEQFNNWLASNHLAENPRLSSLLQVESGWEKAVDTALSKQTASVCVSAIESYAQNIEQMKHVELNFVEKPTSGFSDSQLFSASSLLSKIKSEVDLGNLLDNALVADSLGQAMQNRTSLTSNQYFITRDGTRIGKNWISIAKRQDVESGLIERESMIAKLSTQVNVLRAKISQQEEQRSTIRAELNVLESSRTTHTQELNDSNTKRSELHKQLGQQEEKLRELDSKKLQLNSESAQAVTDLQAIADSLLASMTSLKQTEESVSSNERSRESFEQKRDRLRDEFNATRAEVEQVRDLLDNDNIRLEKMSTALESIQETLSRTQQQLDLLVTRQGELEERFNQPQDQGGQTNEKLQTLLTSQGQVEQQLQQARNHVSDFDTKINGQDRLRQTNEQQAMQMRSKLESSRLDKQEIVVKKGAIKEQLTELEVDIETIIKNIPDDASFETYQENLTQLEAKLERLGTVNLLAIEEYEEQQERKIYLDKQHEDLSTALRTLEDVMHKIDRETKQRFKETFDKLNEGFKEYFPKLFGGGSASLELTDDDLLSTGVTVMARPPGKRNSTIHLLSGGEKALTAVSLMFSLFQLNPAPFCILDEVDAPLDDANVERYCRTLVQMAEHTQLLFITHNKITMEFANVLIGVTMQEPGVSRLVAVDVEKALELAEQG